jgi:hypothetical protein
MTRRELTRRVDLVRWQPPGGRWRMVFIELEREPGMLWRVITPPDNCPRHFGRRGNNHDAARR